jgi:hypothetical protein
MAHFAHTETRARRTPPEWLRVGATIGQLVNEWSSRDDLIAYVGPGAGGTFAAACYNPALAEVEVSVEAAFGPFVTPAHIGDLTDRDTQYEWAKGVGAIYHEAFHARFSSWDIPAAAADLKGKPGVFDALMLLEEGRIEAQGVLVTPRSQPFLHRCALDLVIGDVDLTALTSVREVGNLVGLVHARVEAGVLDERDVRYLIDVIDPIIGEGRIARLREIAVEFQAHTGHYDLTPVYPLAEEWVRILTEAAEERGEALEPGEGEGEGGEGDEGEGGVGTLSPEEIQAVIDAFEEAKDRAEARAERELGDQREDEVWARQVVDAREAAEEREGNAKVAARVFGRADESGSKSRSKLVEARPPKAKERRAAVIVARELDRAKYRDRSVTEIRSAVPPGRLRTRAMVAAAGARSAGVVNPKSEPWKRKARKHTDEPNLTVGQIVDVSGSMGTAMLPTAVAAFVMSEACKRIQARTASVYYGNCAFPTLLPGQYLSEVQIWSAPDSTEKFEDAFRAIDGSLNLLHGDGARILTITSDGCYTASEINACRKWLARCRDAGVVVIWYVPDGETSYVRSHIAGCPNVQIVTGTDPETLALAIGRAAVEGLRIMSPKG